MAETGTGELEYLNALAAFDLVGEVAAGSDEELLIKLKGSYVKLNSIQEITNMCTLIHGKLGAKSTPILREWVKLIRYIHPDVWEQIKDFPYFKGVSEEVGSRIVGYYTDTPSLELEYWSSDAKPTRKIVNNKIDSKTLSMIQDTYKTLNEKMVRSISDEFYNRERREIAYTYTQIQARAAAGLGLVAHDFHIAGDNQYQLVVNSIQPFVENKIRTVLLDSMRLINYINPVNISVNIKNETFSIVPEEKIITVNMRKDLIDDVITKINNSVIEPVEII